MSSNQPSSANINDMQGSSTPTLDDINKATALTLEANECIKNGNDEETIEKLTQALKLFPAPAIFCNRAICYGATKQYNIAINDCHSALKLDSKCARAYATLGLTFTFQNHYNEAIDAYKKALEFDPDNEGYECSLSSAVEKLKASKQTSSPPIPEIISKANALKEEGNECMKFSKFNEAIEKYTEAIALNRDPVYLCNRAAAYCRLQQYTRALNDCGDALLLYPKYAKAHGRLGFIRSCLKLYVYSAGSYRKALELDPNNESYKENLALAESKIPEAYQRP